MTVSELINELADYPQDLEVQLELEGQLFDIEDVDQNYHNEVLIIGEVL